MPQLSVADNIFLGAEISRSGMLRKSEQYEEARALISRFDFALDVGAPRWFAKPRRTADG